MCDYLCTPVSPAFGARNLGHPEFRVNQNISMFLRIRDTNSCQQGRTRPFTNSKRSYKLMSPFQRRRHERKNMKICKLEYQLNKKENPNKDGRREERQLHRPSHEFKFWSMALRMISDEPILMNWISVEPI